MLCPHCHIEMSQKEINGVVLDLCEQGCGGIWFDAMELVKVKNMDDETCQLLTDATKQSASGETDGNRQVKCPHCGISMQAHPYPRVPEVVVDECYACGGFFLDAGELTVIRSRESRQQSVSEEEIRVQEEALLSQSPLYLQEKARLDSLKSAQKATPELSPLYEMMDYTRNI